MTVIRTRLTDRLGLSTPIVSAPMALVAGGRLAAAVSNAGGLGLIGGGYAGHLGAEPDLGAEWRAAGNAAVGIGFIMWALAGRNDPSILQAALDRSPRCLFLSFPTEGSDFQKVMEQARKADVPVMVQVQSVAVARAALDAGADVIVAQGTEAGGHGGDRATMTLVPELADLCATRARDTLVLAAGGIADGRGLAAALALGADGVVVGSRFWSSREALTPEEHTEMAGRATGDETLRTRDLDRARGLAWPEPYSFRVVQNAFVRSLHGTRPEFGSVASDYDAARRVGDLSVVPAVAGEAVGLIRDRPPAGMIVEAMTREASECLRRGASLVE